ARKSSFELAQSSAAGSAERRPRGLGKARAADFLRRARGTLELLASFVQPSLREQRCAAPASRLGRELAQTRRTGQSKQLRGICKARRGIAACERELRQSRQAARELVALAVPATVARRAVELHADLEIAKAQARDRQVGLDAWTPERDACAARKLEAAAAPRRRVLRGAGIEQQMADQIVGDELVADLLQALEP